MKSMSKVYVLYTGGTIGSAGQPLAPMSTAAFAKLVGQMPGLGDGRVAGYDISYVIEGTPKPLDSSNMTPSDWIAIALQVASVYARFDGFVILHGTDTMAFTSSALSFLFEGLSKTIVVTGSQLPLSYTLNDALSNLTGAIVMAATSEIPEVTLYFDYQLFRGNRAAKVNASQVAAFASPNFPALATVGTESTIQTNLILPKPPKSISLSVQANLKALQKQLAGLAESISGFSVIALILYPGISANTVSAMLKGTQPPVSGVVLEAFGEGNGPSNPAFLAVLKAASDAGLVLVDNTQVLMGTVNIDAYATGSGLAQSGAISAYDMTPESSLCKLVYLFAQGIAPAQVKKQMQEDLRGEVTVPPLAPTRSLFSGGPLLHAASHA
jgi:L-asparaginase